jgi:hypothetical protein
MSKHSIGLPEGSHELRATGKGGEKMSMPRKENREQNGESETLQRYLVDANKSSVQGRLITGAPAPDLEARLSETVLLILALDRQLTSSGTRWEKEEAQSQQ